ncbi:MAG: hypothetical protein KKB20_05370 [Proteobacteria bacterium]|nr:hypothetical protein [Pseudomonadota bacterium]
MPKRRKVDAQKLIEAVESGRLNKDVMDTYGVGSQPQQPVKSRYRRKRGAGEAVVLETYPLLDVELKVNKRGSLVLPRSVIDQLGYEEGDVLVARKTKVGISLRKAE